MSSRTLTVAFEGVEARLVEVECVLSAGLPAMQIVGLADKAVSEAKERIRAAFAALSIALPNRRITLSLAPADLPKEGAHFDLPMALALLGAMGNLEPSALEGVICMGSLALDGRLLSVSGALPAALAAASHNQALLCPLSDAGEAAWVEASPVYGAAHLHEVLAHFSAQKRIGRSQPLACKAPSQRRDLSELRGQELGRRALEIAAAGGHHLLFTGPPGAGKSLMASCLPSIMPPLSAPQALESAIIQSLAGQSLQKGLSLERPFCAPHHSASMAAMVGGGRRARPGQISLAHNGVLFLDELPEFAPSVLDSLRQPLENGEILVARARDHVCYPSRFLLVAAANPCKCGYLADPARCCKRAPLCSERYMGRISGPLMDRIDLRLEIPPLRFSDLDLPAPRESSSDVAARVLAARQRQERRYGPSKIGVTNSDADPKALEDVTQLDAESRDLLGRVADRFGMSARAYHRILRVARTIADLDDSKNIRKKHLAEAVAFRLNDGTGRRAL